MSCLTLEASKWLIKVDQGLIWTKHISANGFRRAWKGFWGSIIGPKSSRKWPKLALLQAVYVALKGFLYPGKIPNILPDEPCPDQTLIKFDQPVWSLQGDLWLKKVVLAIFGNFRPLWRPMAPPRGLPGPGKTPKHIVPCVSWPDQTLIKVNQPFWGLQGG